MADTVTVTPKTDLPTADQKYSFNEVRPLAGLLGISTPTDNESTMLKEMAEFFRADKKEFTDIELLHEFRQLENRLGFPSLGERRIDKVYRYIKLQRQIDSLTKQRDKEIR